MIAGWNNARHVVHIVVVFLRCVLLDPSVAKMSAVTLPLLLSSCSMVTDLIKIRCPELFQSIASQHLQLACEARQSGKSPSRRANE